MSHYCSVTSCVRTTDISPKPPSSFLIERTCRYAKNNECQMGHSRHRVTHTITKTITLVPIMNNGLINNDE